MKTKVPWTWLFWCCTAAILVMALMPSGVTLPSTGWDKSNHLLAFGVLTSLGYLAYPSLGWRIMLAMVGYGGLIEVLQGLTPHRYAEWGDVVADMLGAAIGYVSTRQFCKRWGKSVV